MYLFQILIKYFLLQDFFINNINKILRFKRHKIRFFMAFKIVLGPFFKLEFLINFKHDIFANFSNNKGSPKFQSNFIYKNSLGQIRAYFCKKK